MTNNRKNSWNGYSDLKILGMLKKEIERLGLTDNPSRTEVMKRYNSQNMPHPNTYLYKYGTWEKALKMVGIEYDGRLATAASASKTNAGKRYAVKWADMDKDELLDIVLNEMRRLKIDKLADYAALRDKKNTPSIVSVTNATGYGWKEILVLYDKKYSTKENWR